MKRARSKFTALIQEAVACDRQGLILEFNAFQFPEKNRSIFQSAIDLVNMVKLRFRNNDCGYKDFLNAVLSENQYGNAASRLFGHQDLLEEFVRIESCLGQIPEEKETDGETDSEDYRVKKLYRKGLDLFERVQVNITSSEDSEEYLKFLKQVHGYNMKRIAMADVIQSLSKYPDIKAEFEELVEECENIGTGLVHKRLKTEQKCCTPSYWHLPTDYCDRKSQVLNYEWVSKSLVEEKYFRNRPVTLREEILNKCEDDRHELDLFLSRLRSTIAKMEEILRDKLINIEEHLNILHFKCIEKLYGEWSQDVIQALINNPAVVVPVILASLKGKVEECKEHRVTFNNKIWAPIQAGNYLMLKPEQEEIHLKPQLN